MNNLKGKALRAAREKMQIIFQDPYSSLDPRKTASNHPRAAAGGAQIFKGEIEEKTTELMELVGIDERLRKAYPHELDGRPPAAHRHCPRAGAGPQSSSSATSRCRRWMCPSRRRC